MKEANLDDIEGLPPELQEEMETHTEYRYVVNGGGAVK